MSSDKSERGDVRFAGGWVAAGVFPRCGWVMLSHTARAASRRERGREELRGNPDGMVQGCLGRRVRAKQG